MYPVDFNETRICYKTQKSKVHVFFYTCPYGRLRGEMAPQSFAIFSFFAYNSKTKRRRKKLKIGANIIFLRGIHWYNLFFDTSFTSPPTSIFLHIFENISVTSKDFLLKFFLWILQNITKVTGFCIFLFFTFYTPPNRRTLFRSKRVFRTLNILKENKIVLYFNKNHKI